MTQTPAPPSPEKVFIQAVEEGISGDTAARLLAVLASAGRPIDPTCPVNGEGQNVLEAWWAHGGRRWGDRPRPTTVMDWLKKHPGLWDRRARSGRTWAQQILADVIGLDHVQDGVAENAAEWLGVLPESLLRQPMSTRNDRETLKGPNDLLAYLLRKKDAGPVIDVLVGRGWTLTGKTSHGTPVAEFLRTPDQWHLYLAQGGDPDARVTTRMPDETQVQVPLWQHLRQRGGDELEKAMSAWAEQQRKGAIDAVKDAEYWRSLSQWGTSADTLTRVKAARNWPQKRDPEGRNVVMVLAQSRTSSSDKAIFSLMGQPKTWSAGTAMGCTDKWGRGLWPYLLGAGLINRSTPSEALDQIPMANGPKGEGWVHQAFVPTPDGKPCMKEHEAGKGQAESCKGLMPLLEARPELLWGSTPAAQATLATWLLTTMYWGSDTDRRPAGLPQLLGRLAVVAPPPPHSPLLLGVLALMIACTARQQPEFPAAKAAVDALLEQGGVLPASPTVDTLVEQKGVLPPFLPGVLVKNATVWLGDDHQDLWARLAANQLEQNLNQVLDSGGGVTRSRLRL